MENLTNIERCWLLGHLHHAMSEYKKAIGLFDGDGNDVAIRQSIEDDISTVQSIVRKLGG